MPYLSLCFDLADLDRDAAEAACFDTGACSLTFSDCHDDAVLEPAPGEVRLWPATQVQALYEASLADAALIATLAARLHITTSQLRVQAVPDRQWEREWLRDFHAMRVGQRLWICPQHDEVPDPDAIVVKLDPGLAFGTGTHPSTALCLQWLDRAASSGALSGRCLIDYGCGSGILAIAALKLGAATAWAYDIDPQALVATRDNADNNAVRDRLHLCARCDELPENTDVLLANILAGTLCALARDFAARLCAGAHLLLAGILAVQSAEVTAAYAPWFDITHAGEREGWVALAGIRNTCSPSAPSAP